MKFHWKWVPFIGFVVTYIHKERLWAKYSWSEGAKGWPEELLHRAEADNLHAATVTSFTTLILVIIGLILKA